MASRPPAAAARDAGRPIQRVILGETGVQRYWDLAEKQARLDFVLGFTPPTVNARQTKSAADIVDAFTGKDELVAESDDGEGTFSARVGQVPRNWVGYHMYLPRPGPWKTSASKKNVLAALGEQDNGRNPTDVIELEVTGRGGHEKLAKQIEAHEMVHAKDNLRVRDRVLVPWDKRLSSLHDKGTVFTGDSAAEARDALWAAAGGSLAEKAAELDAAWGKASDAFHAHKKGKTVLDKKGTRTNEDQTKAWFVHYLTV